VGPPDQNAGAAVVPAVNSAGSLATVRSLGARGVHVIAVSEFDTPASFSSRYCGETVTVPSPSDDLAGYASALLDLAARDPVEAIVPVRAEDVHVLATERDAFAEHLRTPWPTLEQLRIVHDRTRLLEAARRADVPAPETRLLDRVDEWDRKWIVKGRYAILTADRAESVAAGTCDVPRKTIFLEPGVEPDREALVDRMGHVPIAQRYLDGGEYCVRALYRDGEAVVTSQKRLHRGYKYARGPSVYHEAVDRPGLEGTARALLDELEWHGLASVGFIEAEPEEYALVEVNPRLPGSVPVDVHAGVDYPSYYWDVACGRDRQPAPQYRSGTASHLLRGELVYLHSVLREEYPLVDRPSPREAAWRIGRSLLAQPRFDLLSRDDPAPFVRDVMNTVRAVVSRRRSTTPPSE
jgi:predicted ATP-grasp superfamily ATP-dependent carboligase